MLPAELGWDQLVRQHEGVENTSPPPPTQPRGSETQMLRRDTQIPYTEEKSRFYSFYTDIQFFFLGGGHITNAWPFFSHPKDTYDLHTFKEYGPRIFCVPGIVRGTGPLLRSMSLVGPCFLIITREVSVVSFLYS